MRTKAALVGALVGLVIGLAACGETTASSPGPINPVVASPTPSQVTIAVAANAQLGQILVDGDGRTLYLFVADTGTTSTCTGQCAQYWPPVLTSGAPVAGTGVNAALLGTTTRPDGGTEVTYGGHPLYYVVTDKNPGDTTGQAVNNYGALWYVVGPDGKEIA